MQEFRYSIVDGIDSPFEEQGNQFSAFRKIRWGDNENTHYEIRRWRNNPDGTEQCAKGFTFMTEEGPAELIGVLIGHGFGETRSIIKKLSEREDFRQALNSVLGKDDELYDPEAGNLEDNFYDPKQLIGG